MRSVNSRLKGFTLVELVLVMVVIALLGAAAIPRYVNKTTSEMISAKKDKAGAIKHAMMIAIADSRHSPNVSQLASYVQGETVAAIPEGITVNIKGDRYTVPTYVDTNCTQQTKSLNDVVECVGEIP